MYERQAGQIALDQARSPRVKDFARMMTRAHRYTSRNLQAALENSGRQIPIPDSLDSRHEEMLDRLQNARDFDRAYIRQQERAHRQALALVRDYRENGRDPALRRVAAQTEPVIERHLAMLDRIDRRG